MLSNCGSGEDSWQSLGLQGVQSSPSLRKSVLNIHWKDWCWSWSSNTVATSCKELTYWERPWCRLPGWLRGKEFAWNIGDAGLTPGSGRSSGEGNGNPLQYSLPGKSHGQRSLVGYSPWGHKHVGQSWVAKQQTTAFAGKDWGQEEKGVKEDEMVQWHHWLNGLKFKQTLGDSEWQGSWVSYNLWGLKELDMT